MVALRLLFIQLAAFAFSVAPIGADVLEVPGDYADLQIAIDNANPGDTIVVHGGTWPPITITKPLSLVGLPTLLVEPGSSGASVVAPITLAGPGSGEVTLSNVRALGNANGFLQSFNAPGIIGGGFSELHVYDSEIRAPQWILLTGLGIGEAGIDVTVPFVLIERSVVRGGLTDIDDTPITAGFDGGAGIVAPGTVVVLDSDVRGGNSGLFCFPSGSCDFGCPGGRGGVGVQADTLYQAASIIEGGAGARWKDAFGTFCCQFDDGAPASVSTLVALANDLVGDGPVFLGKCHTLTSTAPGPSAFLLTSLEVDPPLASGFGPLFLGGRIVLTPVTTPGDVVVRVPLVPELVGTEVGFQLLDPTTGLSRPVASGLLLPNVRRHGPPENSIGRAL